MRKRIAGRPRKKRVRFMLSVVLAAALWLALFGRDALPSQRNMSVILLALLLLIPGWLLYGAYCVRKQRAHGEAEQKNGDTP